MDGQRMQSTLCTTGGGSPAQGYALHVPTWMVLLLLLVFLAHLTLDQSPVGFLDQYFEDLMNWGKSKAPCILNGPKKLLHLLVIEMDQGEKAASNRDVFWGLDVSTGLGEIEAAMLLEWHTPELQAKQMRQAKHQRRGHQIAQEQSTATAQSVSEQKHQCEQVVGEDGEGCCWRDKSWFTVCWVYTSMVQDESRANLRPADIFLDYAIPPFDTGQDGVFTGFEPLTLARPETRGAGYRYTMQPQRRQGSLSKDKIGAVRVEDYGGIMEGLKEGLRCDYGFK
ncbi:hypothetical protein B0H17DRAFT_1135457 [Mycena rosella]|uniref:Uncharacterized protein n=1 Tax=Mycena rosella TaxID=1033263 RepID=A0AAD7GD19_MYCRO|nr:hypothetical protein B0H17DRAFT_1135457 [Mycena rosella]